MQIIQNLEAIQLVVKSDKRINFPVDTLQGKKINSFILFNPLYAITSPYNSDTIVTLGDVSEENYYLNCIDNKGNHFVQDLLISKNPLMDVSLWFNFDIKRVLDLYKSYIRFPKKSSTTARPFLLLANYQTQPLQPFDDTVNGCIEVTLQVTADHRDVCLKDVIPNTLRRKKIKKIFSKSLIDRDLGYLDLVGLDGKIIRNLPTTMLEKEIWFDNIDIDYDNSFFRERGSYAVPGDDDMPFRTTYLTFIF